MNAAQVVCRQLGYSRAMAIRHNAYFGRSRGPIQLDQLQCRGAEESVLHCGHRPIGVANGCNHNHDVGVVCYSSAQHSYCDKGARRNGKGINTSSACNLRA